MENNNEYDQEAFEIFAYLHPVEAYDLDSSRFCEYVRTKHRNVPDEEIKKLIDECRKEDEVDK